MTMAQAIENGCESFLTRTGRFLLDTNIVIALFAEDAAGQQRLAEANEVFGVACDTATAQQYGDIKSKLRAKGRPIPENDIWIAASVMPYPLALVAHDRHFHEVDGLQIEDW
jgi:tRNA(fMet)-specific endonuclease VapC